uniref:trimeric intracellular cation channel family protein n=1 Tax=Pararhizobium sp. IMCC3301 TaxID=3067904 RepID=UPI0027408A48|nr:trimeric intracellular cation channel family protein [Pararhizobium sp. IMCC3301]
MELNAVTEIDVQQAFNIFALIGTAVFAISGALLGLRNRMDVVGVSFVATVTGVGGGTLRDLLLGATPVSWVVRPLELEICIVSAVLVSLLNSRLLGRRMQWLLYADAAGLALFCVLGAAKAEAAGAHPLVAILFGAMSASFGGLLRDVICNEVPVIMRREIYITAALAGASVYILLPASLGFDVRGLAGLIVALVLRVSAIHFGWNLPFPKYKSD